jgi:hypothetical protein
MDAIVRAGTRLRVDALALNLRSAPEVRAGTRVAVLPQGHPVTVAAEAAPSGWLRVETRLDGREVAGYVASRYVDVEPDDGAAPVERDAPIAPAPPAVHLREGHAAARRDRTDARAFPLGEADAPAWPAEGTAAERAAALRAIVDWLDVERSARYAAAGASTYCNIYACDVCYLARAYLPRVWWSPAALAAVAAGATVAPRYGESLLELNANSLFAWLRGFGGGYGWRRLFDADALQREANDGHVGVIVAERTELNQPGHIAVVVPEGAGHSAQRRDGAVVRPLQSQAGRTNQQYGTPLWWTGARYREFGFWVNEG